MQRTRSTAARAPHDFTQAIRLSATTGVSGFELSLVELAGRLAGKLLVEVDSTRALVVSEMLPGIVAERLLK